MAIISVNDDTLSFLANTNEDCLNDISEWESAHPGRQIPKSFRAYDRLVMATAIINLFALAHGHGAPDDEHEACLYWLPSGPLCNVVGDRYSRWRRLTYTAGYPGLVTHVFNQTYTGLPWEEDLTLSGIFMKLGLSSELIEKNFGRFLPK